MTDFDRTNTGAIFKNDMEGKSDKAPGYGGSINVEGVEYWVSAWVKDGKKGKFFSLAIKPKEERQESTRAPKRNDKPAAGGGSFDPEDDIPFAPLSKRTHW
jgi:hypothetical protein